MTLATQRIIARLFILGYPVRMLAMLWDVNVTVIEHAIRKGSEYRP